MSYNTQFKVKYYDIEQELMYKLKQNTEENDFSSEDVLDICNKLYRDEFLSVFGAENINDDTIDNGLKHVNDIMMTNDKFKEIINEISNLTIQFYKNEELNSEKLEGLNQLILISLFSQHLFYITHKCICQQIELGIIDEALLVELKINLMDLFKNQTIC